MNERIPEPLVPDWAHAITGEALDDLGPLDRWVADAGLLRAYQGAQLLFDKTPGSRLKKNGEWRLQAAALMYALSLRRVCAEHDADGLLQGDTYERIRAVVARALPGAEGVLDDPAPASSCRLLESINRSAGLKKAPTGKDAFILLQALLVGLNASAEQLAIGLLGEPPPGESSSPEHAPAPGALPRHGPVLEGPVVPYLTGDALGFEGEAQRGVDLCLAFGLQVWNSIMTDMLASTCDPELGAPALVGGFLAAAPVAERRWGIDLLSGDGRASWQVATVAREVGFDYDSLIESLAGDDPQGWLSGLALGISELLAAAGVVIGEADRMQIPMRLAAAKMFLDEVA